MGSSSSTAAESSSSSQQENESVMAAGESSQVLVSGGQQQAVALVSPRIEAVQVNVAAPQVVEQAPSTSSTNVSINFQRKWFYLANLIILLLFCSFRSNSSRLAAINRHRLVVPCPRHRLVLNDPVT
jgi:hypothetical protein